MRERGHQEGSVGDDSGGGGVERGRAIICEKEGECYHEKDMTRGLFYA